MTVFLFFILFYDEAIFSVDKLNEVDKEVLFF